jgi:hypothetical protein
MHQRRGVADLARERDRALSVCARRFGKAKEPLGMRPRRQRTVARQGIVKRDSLVEVRPTFQDVARDQQGTADEAMANHQRNRRPLLLGQC